jgi:hypothetical protein
VGWFWNKKRDGFDAALAALNAPGAAGREGILAFVRRHTPADPAAEGLTERGVDLPDEPPSETGIRWAAGAMDGAFGGFGGGESAAQVVGNLVRATRAMLDGPDEKRAAALYGQLSEHTALSHIDGFLSSVREGNPDGARVRALGRWLVERSVDRDPVKFGIGLIGVGGTSEDSELLMAIGRHEEFTLYAIVALVQVADEAAEAEGSLLELGRRVTGWGRVHAVRYLSEIAKEHPLSDETRRWLLTDGSSNAIMTEYTAVIGAEAGRLVEALRESAVGRDGELLKGAGQIITAMMGTGGPADTIEAYEHGPECVELYVEAASRSGAGERGPTLVELETVLAINEFLGNEKVDWTAGSLGRWSGDARGRVSERCRRLLASAAAREAVEVGLRVDASDADFWQAAHCAQHVGIDPWEARFTRLAAGKNEWWGVMQTKDPARAARVVEFAVKRLSLASMIGRPTGVILPMGDGAADHNALDWVISGLGAFPGLGWDLVRTGLGSPFTRPRNASLRVLHEWGRSSWPADAAAALDAAIAAEVDKHTKSRMERVKRGEPPDLPPGSSAEVDE